MEKMCFLKSIEQTLSKVFSFQEFESQPCEWKHSLFHLKTCFHFLKKPEFGACPESHPWAFARGSRCCSRPLRRTGGNDTSACPPTSDKEASPVLGFTDPGEYLFYGKLSVVGCLKIGKFFRGLLRGFRLCCLPGRCGVLLFGKRCDTQIPHHCRRNHMNLKTVSSGEDQLPRVQPGRPLARDKVLPVEGEGGELPNVPKVNVNSINWENGVCNNATFFHLQQERLLACVDRPRLLLPRGGVQRHRLPGGESMRDAHKDGENTIFNEKNFFWAYAGRYIRYHAIFRSFGSCV